MTPANTSRIGRVGRAHEPDSSDAFDALDRSGWRDGPGSVDTHGSLSKPALPDTQAPHPGGCRNEPGAGGTGLLDSCLPGVFSVVHDRHASNEVDGPIGYVEPFECAVAREAQYALWPVLAPLRGSRIQLVSLSLSTPREERVREDGARLAAEVDTRPGEGVILSLDVGPRHGRLHFYALCLARDPAELCARWRSLTGASPQHTTRKPITGWQAGAHTTFGNLGTVLGYAFKPWPSGFGRRLLDRDVFASGVLGAPWRAAMAALDLSPRPDPHLPAKASEGRRVCPHCGGALRPGKRSHATWCSNACKSAAWERAHPRRKSRAKDHAEWMAECEREAARYEREARGEEHA